MCLMVAVIPVFEKMLPPFRGAFPVEVRNLYFISCIAPYTWEHVCVCVCVCVCVQARLCVCRLDGSIDR